MSGLFLFCDPDPVLSFIDSVQVQSQSKKNSNIKSKSRWSPKNRKMQPLHKKMPHFFSIDSVQIRSGSYILMWFTAWIQSKFN